MVVADGDMVVESRVADGSGLLVSWVGAEGGGCGLDLVGGVGLSVVVFGEPDFSGSDAALVADAELMELVVVAAGQEGSLLRNHLQTPALAVVVRHVHDGLVSAFDANGGDTSVIVADEDLAVKVVDGAGLVKGLERDLTDIFEGALVAAVDGHLVVRACRHEHALVANNGSARTCMGFQDDSQLASLIPAVHSSVGTSTIAETLLVEGSAQELGLTVLLSEGSILEQLLRSIGRMPELK